jgi:serine/threonine protein kinase
MMTPTLLNYRYKVISTLGSGGFGDTFLAEDTQMPSGRRCVIKQLKPLANDPKIYQLVQERFQREAAILEDLGSGNNYIPTLYAYFEENGQFYLIQEYIEGQTITQKSQQGRFSESSVKEILANILPILDYVHSKRIVHRDIKPDNIILRNSDGKPTLIDFGAVKETMGTVLTSSGNSSQSIVIGTPGFMPSEQSVGRPVYSSDLYSLGLTAIYLLTGKIPQEFTSDPATGEMMWRQQAPNVTPSFANFLDKAIQSHSRDRYQSANEMLQALYAGTTPIAATQPVSQPTLISAPVTPAIPQTPTVLAAPVANSYPQQQASVAVPTREMSDLWKATIIGSLIGGCVIIGLWLTRGQQTAQTAQTETNATTNVTSQNPSPAPVIPATNSSTNNISPTPTQSSTTSTPINPTSIQPEITNVTSSSSITKQQAVDVIYRWLAAKKELFAYPFNRQLGGEITTGEAYRKNIGSDGSLEWLQNNNAYYSYGVQRINSVANFAANGNQATIEVSVTEDRKFYKSGTLVNDENTAFSTSLVRYSLQMENGQLKISDYSTVR